MPDSLNIVAKKLLNVLRSRSRWVCAGYVTEAQAFADLYQAGIPVIRGSYVNVPVLYY